MKALVRAEVDKLRSTRTNLGLLVATLAMVTLTVTFEVPEVGNENAPMSLDDPSLLAVAVGVGFGGPLVLMVLLGVVAFTQEFRYGTITSTYLVEPRRTRVLIAKWIAMTLVSVVITAATLAVSVPLGIAVISSRDGEVTLGAEFWQMVVAGFAVMAVFGIIGVAIGALVRNQITAVVAVLVWTLAVERLVIDAFPEVGRWMPQATSWVLMQLGPSYDPEGKLLSVFVSGLVMAVYAAVAVALALRLSPKKDVL